MCRVEDAEPWTLLDQSTPTARVDRPCCECHRTIRRGEKYWRNHGLSDGAWHTYSQCTHCVSAAEWLVRECGGYLFTCVYDELVEHWREDTIFQSVWLARAIAGMHLQWLDGRMPVPEKPPVLEAV